MEPTIAVARHHIEDSEKRSSSHCMIAEAIAEALPDATRVSVDVQTIRYTRSGKRYSHLTPRKVQEAIIKFDVGIHLEPFSFGLRQPHVTQCKPSTPGTHPREARRIVLDPKGRLIRTEGGAQLPKTNLGRRRMFGLRSMTM